MRPDNNSRFCPFFVLFISIIFLSSSLCPAQQADKEPPSPPDASKQAVPAPNNFFARWRDFYRQDWSPQAASSAEPAPARRGLPSPLDSPPFPNSDWSYGGAPVIGEPDTNSYPLMTAINGARSRTKIYGWIDPTLNFSNSAHNNAPEANDDYSNRLELNQIVLYAERLPDSVQREHMDWGYHLTALYGTDYRFTIAKGYLSGQLLNDHHQYGFDPTLEYVDVYIPQVAQGMNLRLGRFISVPGIEAQLAPNNYIFSHSLLYAIDPFTDTGLMATVKLNDQWLVQLGITAGHDVAPWTPDAKPFRHSLPELYHQVRERQCLPLRQRHQRRQVRLQQSAAVRHHLVSQVFEDGAYGDRVLVHVRARRAGAGRQYQAGNGRQCRVLFAGRAALHRSRICGG